MFVRPSSVCMQVVLLAVVISLDVFFEPAAKFNQEVRLQTAYGGSMRVVKWM